MAESTKSTPLHVLLVEDNEHDKRAFQRALDSSETTFKITDCQRGEEALALLGAEGNGFDIVVTDYSMPGFTGVDLCRELKSRQIGVPLVVLTGTGSERVAIEALKAGAYDYLIKDPDNGYLELLELVLVDVVQRHRDRLEHRKTEENARAILDNAAEGIITIDQNCRVETFNPAAVDMFGYTADEIIGQNVNVLIPEPDHSRHDGYIRNYLQTGKGKILGVRSRELEAQRKDGTIFPIELNVSELFVGNLRRFVGSVHDITVRKQAEKGLRSVADAVSSAAGEGLFDRLVENLVSSLNVDYGFIGELVDGPKTRIRTLTFFADGAKTDNIEYDLAGTPCENVIGRTSCVFNENVQDKFPEDKDLVTMGIESYIGMPLFDAEKEAIGIIVLLSRSPLDNPKTATDLLSIIAVRAANEIERNKAEEKLRLALVDAENANHAKSEFLASMSHDLRTPLNAILGFADILSNKYFGPINKKYQEYAEDIHSSGEYLLTLVNDLLDLSTIEAGKQALVKEKLLTKEIIAECVRTVADKAYNSGLNLIIKGPDNFPPLFADRRAIKQILLNLLSNAVKFTPEGGKVTVSAKASKQETVIKIADTGKGIPVKKLPTLTDPFTRVVGDPYLTEKGWGLGLTITKSLVDLHDGKLDIKSKVGRGTTVTVTLPNSA